LEAEAILAYYSAARDQGGKNVEAAIATGVAIGTGMFAPSTLTVFQKALLASVAKGSTELGLVGAQALDGVLTGTRVVTTTEMKAAIRETLAEGGTTYLAGWAADLLAKPLCSLLLKSKPTAAQVDMVKGLLENYYKSNLGLVKAAFEDIVNGRKPTYKAYNSLLEPVVKMVSDKLVAGGHDVVSFTVGVNVQDVKSD